MEQTVTFRCFPFKLKFIILAVFVLLEITSGQNISKIEQYFGEKGPKKF